MSGYERLSRSDPEDHHEGNTEFSPTNICLTCGSEKGVTRSWLQTFRGNRSLVVWLLVVFIVLLVINLIVSARACLQGARSEEHERDKVQGSLHLRKLFPYELPNAVPDIL